MADVRLRHWMALACCMAFLWAMSGCDPTTHVGRYESSEVEPVDPAPTSGTEVNTSSNGNPQIIIGSFNIQQFGETKMSKPGVMSMLVDIARRFDLLAIQELRDGDESVIYDFVEMLNADGSEFAFSVGPPEGYRVNGRLSNYREQAVYVYDSRKLRLLTASYSAPNPGQVMQRAPFVGHFQCTNVPPEQAFSFVLLNVHVTPRPARTRRAELTGLRSIMSSAYQMHAGEDDFILIGDLNEEPDKFNHYGWMSTQFAAIPSSWKTNTRLRECYDNLVFDANYTAEFTGQSGVMNIMMEYGISLEEALAVSDHLTVWAVFSCLEAPQATIKQSPPSDVIR